MAAPRVAAVLGALLAWAPSLRADPVAATGKGIVGGALLGADTVLITESILRVKPRWAYALGGALGATLGGVTGYFVEDSGDARGSMLLLVAGTALLVPASIMTLDATIYQEPKDPMRDTPKRAAPPSRSPAAVSVDAAGGAQTLNLSAPVIALAPVYSREEIATFGLRQHPSVRMPIFSMVF